MGVDSDFSVFRMYEITMRSLQQLLVPCSSSSPSSPCAVMTSTVGRLSILLPIFFLLPTNDANIELKYIGYDHVEKAPYSDGKVIFLIRDEFGDGLVEPWSVFGRTRSPLHVVGYLSKGAGQT